MLVAAVILVIAAPDPAVDVAAAQALFDDARYTDALEALAPGCNTAADPVGCERLRAFIHVALGNAFEARAAFDSMLALDPDASLGPDVAPKLQAMFGDAKRAMVDVRAMHLEPLTRSEKGKALLEVKNPEAGSIEGITVHIESGGGTFAAVPLALEGEVWSATTKIPALSKARYYMVASLAGNVTVDLGRESDPLEVTVAGSTAGPGDGIGPDLGAGANESGLPAWAPWAIGGGIAAAVAAAVVVGVVVGTQKPAPGSLGVTVAFQE
jgi:hypothetical protein